MYSKISLLSLFSSNVIINSLNFSSLYKGIEKWGLCCYKSNESYKGDKIRMGTIKRLFEEKCHLLRFEIYDNNKLNIQIYK